MGELSLVLVDDLMLWSRIEAAAKRLGKPAVRAQDAAAVAAAIDGGGVGRVLLDLDFRGFDALAEASRWKASKTPPTLVAFGSHVDAEALESARRAGFDRVLPRSRFVRELEELLRG